MQAGAYAETTPSVPGSEESIEGYLTFAVCASSAVDAIGPAPTTLDPRHTGDAITYTPSQQGRHKLATQHASVCDELNTSGRLPLGHTANGATAVDDGSQIDILAAGSDVVSGGLRPGTGAGPVGP